MDLKLQFVQIMVNNLVPAKHQFFYSFMRILKYLLLINIVFSSSINAQLKLSASDTYSIIIDDSKYLLPQLHKASFSKDGDLFYCDLNQILKFDSKGNFVVSISPMGRGPGEFQVLADCITTNSHLVVLPYNEFKLILYSLNDLTFIEEYNLGSIRARRVEALSDSAFAIQHDAEKSQYSSAITYLKIKQNGKMHSQPINVIPEMGYVGSTTFFTGGLATIDNTIFYNYVSYHEITKFNIDTESGHTLNDKPQNFNISFIDELNELKQPFDHRYYRGYMYSRSRSMGLFSTDSLLIQQIEYNNPWEGGTFDSSVIERSLEFWDVSSSQKIIGGLSVDDKRLQIVQNNKFYFNSGLKFSEESAKIQNGNRLVLFDIYLLER
ncbi:MAG: 6-bladed beta-propeller [Balneolaceae bacterium]|nr:6-bladed beta-propeller [Balneolaceae bacterium]